VLLAAGREPDKVIGQCWPGRNSPNGVNEMFINPTQADPVKVLGILTHEMVHATTIASQSMEGPSKRSRTKIGLEGKMKSAFPGPVLLVVMRGSPPLWGRTRTARCLWS